MTWVVIAIIVGSLLSSGVLANWLGDRARQRSRNEWRAYDREHRPADED
jgi:hypothetical protein